MQTSAKTAKGGVNSRLYDALVKELEKRPDILASLRQAAAVGVEIAEAAERERAAVRAEGERVA